MNLYTSVFKSVEARVLGLLVLTFVVLEFFFASAAPHLSQDVAKIEGLNNLSEELASKYPHRILFLGNSILLAGIDPELFVSLSGNSPIASPPSVFMAHPDSSNIVIWSYLLDRYFLNRESYPEEVVIVTGRTHLEDQYANPVDLGGYYVDQPDVRRFLNLDAQSFDDKCHFFLGRWSETFRIRKRVSPRVYDAILPHFQENWIHLHSPRPKLVRPGDIENTPIKADSPVSTTHLETIINRLQQNQIRLTIVKAPMPTPYVLHPEIQTLINSHSIDLIDMSDLAAIGPDHFADADHLTPSGKILFTRALADAMNKRGIYENQNRAAITPSAVSNE